MESKIKKLFRQDIAAILFMLAALWIVLIYAMTQIMQITTDPATGIAISMIGVVAGSFATASLMAVLVHLRKNKNKLYSEEINSLEGSESNNGSTKS